MCLRIDVVETSDSQTIKYRDALPKQKSSFLDAVIENNFLCKTFATVENNNKGLQNQKILSKPSKKTN